MLLETSEEVGTHLQCALQSRKYYVLLADSEHGHNTLRASIDSLAACYPDWDSCCSYGIFGIVVLHGQTMTNRKLSFLTVPKRMDGREITLLADTTPTDAGARRDVILLLEEMTADEANKILCALQEGSHLLPPGRN